MPRRRSRRRAPRRYLWAGVLALGGLIFALGFYLGSRSGTRPSLSGPDAAPPPPPPLREPASETVAPLASPVPLALVIDDLGRSLVDLEDLERLGVPLTYAVLPFESRTREVVAALGSRSKEILCHLPMQPRNGADPGPGALTREMSPRQLAVATRAALDSVPGAVGVNNHMGSGIAGDPGAMRAVLEVIAERGLFFLDSRTSADSLGYELALSLGIPAAERQVFLDADPRPEEVAGQFRRFLELGREKGAAIAIAHPRPETLAVLAREIPRARALGYQFVPVSYLLDRTEVVPQ